MDGLYLGELATALFYLAVGLRLTRLAARSGETPERLLGLVFLVTGTSYLVYWMPVPSLWTAAAFAGRLLYLPAPILLAVFTQRVFRPEAAWAVRIVHASAILLAVGVSGSVWRGDLEGFSISNPWFWPEWVGYTLPFAWAGGEALRLYAQARRRTTLGLCDPVVCNRFLLWGLFGAAQVVASLAVLGQYAAFERGGEFTPGWELALSVIEIGSLLPMWLVFFPPARYRRFIGRSAPTGSAALA